MSSDLSDPDKSRQTPLRERVWWGMLVGGVGGIAGATFGGVAGGMGLTGLGFGIAGFGVVPGALAGAITNGLAGKVTSAMTARRFTGIAGFVVGLFVLLWLSSRRA